VPFLYLFTKLVWDILVCLEYHFPAWLLVEVQPDLYYFVAFHGENKFVYTTSHLNNSYLCFRIEIRIGRRLPYTRGVIPRNRSAPVSFRRCNTLPKEDVMIGNYGYGWFHVGDGSASVYLKRV